MIYETQLYHHGIKGQKWGVQNGPPYPIDEAKKQIKKKVRTAIKNSRNNRRNAEEYTNQFKGRTAARIIGTAGAVAIGMTWTIGFMKGKV